MSMKALCNQKGISLLGSCRLANINLKERLTNFLNQIQGHLIQKLTELLPTHWCKISI